MVRHGSVADSVLRLTGASVAFEKVTLYSQTYGYLRSLKADIDDCVRAGELLATIETPALRVALEEKQAKLQRAAVTTKKSRASLEQSRLEAAFAGVTFHRLQFIRNRDSEVTRGRMSIRPKILSTSNEPRRSRRRSM